MKQKIVVMLAAVFLVVGVVCSSAVGQYEGGGGTAGEPYEIATAQQLVFMGDDPDNWDKHFILTADIDMMGVDMMPTGKFTGSFDGDGFIISNLSMNIYKSSNKALFGVIGNKGIVSNLGLEEISIKGRNYLGGLCGANYGTISHSFATGSVRGWGEYLGGLCGANYGTISQCYASGSVSGGGEYLGGLCGANYGTISQCYASGSVSGGGEYLGGLCGINEGMISQSYATGLVTGDKYLGGLCGENHYGTITQCYSTGSVSGRDDSRNLGGLCGKNHYGTITQSYATGSVSGGDDSRWLGGLCGANNDTISQCYAIGSISGRDDSRYLGGLCGENYYGTISQCYANGSISGRDDSRYLGGLCGENYYGTISQCYANGLVSGGSQLGGLCGNNWKGTISQCYATGSVRGGNDSFYLGGLCGNNEQGMISQCYASGSVSGGNDSYYLGGLCGYNHGGTISQCYAIGPVSGGSNVGGLCEESYGNISNCFWDKDSSGLTSSAGGRGVMGLTTVQMKQSFYYSINGWTDGSWIIDEGNDYPHLAWEKAFGEVIKNPDVPFPGDGTDENPWQIARPEDLVLISWGSYFWDKNYVLTADIDLNGISIKSIGYNKSNAFIGVFDGGGFIISNLVLDMPGIDCVALFGYIGENGLISNLGLEDVFIVGRDCLGGLCGYNSRGKISQCYATGSVNGDQYLVGGLCGANSYGAINQCFATCSVNGSDELGGLCGSNHYGRITQCYSTGSVIGNKYLGGLCGRNYYSGKISQCYATGSVSGGDSSEYLGGLCGRDSGTITQCFWDIETSGTIWSDGGTGLTTASMQMDSTFIDAGWDFVTPIWFMREGEYPRLWWEGVETALKLTPRTLNCRSQGNWVKAHLTLPAGFTVEDIDTNTPATLQPLGLTSGHLEVFINKEKLVEVVASFDREEFCGAAGDLSEGVAVFGYLTDGTVFYGTASVRIITPGLQELAELSTWWLQSNCDKPHWCNGLDLNRDSVVNMLDFTLLQKSNIEFVSK